MKNEALNHSYILNVSSRKNSTPLTLRQMRNRLRKNGYSKEEIDDIYGDCETAEELWEALADAGKDVAYWDAIDEILPSELADDYGLKDDIRSIISEDAFAYLWLEDKKLLTKEVKDYIKYTN